MQSRILGEATYIPELEAWGYRIGRPGQPFFWLSDAFVLEDWGGTEIGDCIIVFVDDVKYIYKVKEYKDGWWRLEWPD